MKYVGLFSGGKDSLVMCHYLWKKGELDEVAYSKTGIGVEENFDYVVRTCKKFGWKLNILEPKIGETYNDFVRRFGFPKKGAHNMVMGFLKYHPWRAFSKSRGGIIYASARRLKEKRKKGVSKRRERIIRKLYLAPSGYEEDGKWLKFYWPIVYWSDKEVFDYIKKHDLELCPVYETLHLSGDCLCGALTHFSESYLISVFHKKLADTIEALEKKYGGSWGNHSSISGARKTTSMEKYLCESCVSLRQ